MRELILKMSLSADGFVGGPNGEIDWLFRNSDPEAAAWTVDTLWQAGLHIMGRKTFADMAAWWPGSTEVFAKVMNDIPKAVFTRQKDYSPLNAGTSTAALEAARRANPEATKDEATAIAKGWTDPYVASGDLSEEINRLKAQDGKPIVAHGGAGFARSLISGGLVDEFRLLVSPVVIGSGLAIFTDAPQPFDLHLVSSTAFPGGALANIYRPRRTS